MCTKGCALLQGLWRWGDVGGCERRNKNGAHGGAGYVVGMGAE
jgi:hypothetical protein